MFFALHTDPQERQDFLARKAEHTPHLFAALGRGLSSLTASIGSLLGMDSSRGFDRTQTADHNQDAVHPLPLSH